MIINEKLQQSNDLLENILLNSGIKDIDLFLQPDNSNDSKLNDFTHLEEASKNLLYHMSKGSKITITVDPDADGYTSSAILINFLEDINKNYGTTSEIEFIMQEGKQHGLNTHVLNEINSIEPNLVILPDAGTNDIDELLNLSTMEYEVLVIDHHEIEKEDLIDMIEGVIIVNNQRVTDVDKTNKWFTGAGMVYNLIKTVYGLLETNENKLKSPDHYLDLVALGQIGDMSDISDNEIRNIVFKGLENVNNPFIKSVLKAKGVSLKNVTPQDLSFSIIPIINAITRIGTDEEKYKLFQAMITTEEDNVEQAVMKRKLNKETRKYEQVEFIMPLTDIVADESVKVKTRQDSVVKKSMTKLDKQTNNNEGILIYVTDQLESGSITGLVATKLSRKYDKPCLVLIPSGDKDSEDYGEYYSGSARGIEKVMDSFKDWCDDSGLFEFARGHANAFGVSIHSDHLQTLSKKVLEFDATPSDTYEVDKKYTRTIVKQDVDDIIEFKYIIGGKVESPLFGFEDITVPRKHIYTKGKTIEFYVGGVAFVMWQSPEELTEELTTGFSNSFKLNFIGQPFEVNFSGKAQNKVVIKDMEIVKDNEEDAFFF